MELTGCFLNFYLKSLLFAMLGFLSTLLLLWLNQIAICTISNTCPLFTTKLHWIDTWIIVYKPSLCCFGKHSWSDFISNSWMLLSKKCDICNWLKSTFWHRVGQCSTLCSQNIFRMYSRKRKGCLLNNLRKSRESILTLQLSAFFWIFCWTKYSEKKLIFVQPYQKRKNHLTVTKIQKNLLV